MLEVTSLSNKILDKIIISNISFKLAYNETISLFGPSGCGKTMILKLIIDNKYNNTNVLIRNSFKKLASVFQEPRLLPWCNVLDNILLVSDNSKQNYEKIKDLLLSLGLLESDFLKYPNELSGGMKQRVAFARALIINPDLLLLDEAFSGLDFQLKISLQDIIIEYLEKQNAAAILVSHDAFEVLKMSNRIYILGGIPTTILDIIEPNVLPKDRDLNYVQELLPLLIK